jgi:hypothetical protein
MIRGSTPTHEFTLPFDTSFLSEVEIVYAQNDKQILLLDTERCAMNNNTISVTLTQEETLKFDCYKRFVQVQLRVKTTEDIVMIGDIITVDLDKCLFDGVI